MNTIVILLASILAFATLYYRGILLTFLFKREYRDQSGIAAPVLAKHRSFSFTPEPVITPVRPRGYSFEEFVISRFPQSSFTLLSWRSSTYMGSHYTLSNTDPDLVMEYRNQSRTIRFAIECKWRRAFKNGFIEWARDYQVSDYFSFQQSEDMPVFIIIGVGDSEDDPGELFMIPLKDIEPSRTHLYHNFLNQYKWGDMHKIFLDTEKLSFK